MDQEERRPAEENTPRAAARFLRGSAASIRARDPGVSQYRAEYQALIDWARESQRLLPFSYIERFAFIGDGAEHRVYKDGTEGCAIKSTHPNKLGYSTYDEGRWATPSEYLTRLGWQNLLFGDDLRIVGVAYEDGQMEVVTSQPWIDVHPIRPNPSKEEVGTRGRRTRLHDAGGWAARLDSRKAASLQRLPAERRSRRGTRGRLHPRERAAPFPSRVIRLNARAPVLEIKLKES